MSDESFVAPGFIEQERPAREAPTSEEPPGFTPGLTSGTALSVLWWIAEDDADDAANDSAAGPR